MYPNFDIFNSPYLQNLYGGPKKPGWSEATPFRTVDNGHQYGSGLNASAGQLYQHFHRKATLDKMAGNPDAKISDYGLTPGHNVQSIGDFANSRNPEPPQIPAGANPPMYGGGAVPPPMYPVSGVGGLNPAGQSGGSPMSLFNQPMQMPVTRPAPGQSGGSSMSLPNMSASIFNMPQFNRR
jgi:hypothetical protein